MKQVILLIFFTFLLTNCDYKKRAWDPNNSGTSNIAQNTPAAAAQDQKILFSDVKPLFEKHCMFCHNVAPKIDWLDYQISKAYADSGKLYARIWTLRDDVAKAMPLGNAFGMTPEERQLIVKWIEDGGTQ